MRHLVLLLLLPLAAHGQDHRWTLLPDSMVLAPFTDLRQAAALRLTSDDLRRAANLEIIARMSEANALRGQVAELKRGLGAATLAAGTCDNALDLCGRERDGWEKKAVRRMRFATILAAVSIGLTIATFAP